MSITTAKAAIATLIDLAQQGDIDPWDVQVIEVIDRFLRALGLSENPEISTYEADLPQSGQAFLWASMLVLLKADTLEQWQLNPEDETAVTEEEEEIWDEAPSLPPTLEHHLRRRSTAPPPRKRPVTLAELIEQIEQMASTLESERPRRTRRLSVPRRQATAEAIAQLAHGENLTEVATQLEQFFAQLSPEVMSNSVIDFERLVTLWRESLFVQSSVPQSSASSINRDRVGLFWALLLLCAQSKVELTQDQFYQDLSIRPSIAPSDTLTPTDIGLSMLN